MNIVLIKSLSKTLARSCENLTGPAECEPVGGERLHKDWTGLCSCMMLTNARHSALKHYATLKRLRIK